MSEDALNFLKFFESYFQHLESFIANPQADCEAMIKLAAVTKSRMFDWGIAKW